MLYNNSQKEELLMDNLREGGQENQVRGTGSLPSRFVAASTKKRHIISVLYVLFFLVFLLLLCLLDLNDYFTLAVCLFLGAMFVLDAVKYDFGKTISVEEDKLTVSRARKIQRFLSQPFHVAEKFTGVPGVYVPLEETIRGFCAIISGEMDSYPESAFYNVGTIDDAIKKAETL